MAHVLNSSNPSVRIALSSRGNYSNLIHAPSFILMERLTVPQDSIALFNLNRLMMSQPDLLYDEMMLTIRRFYKDGRQPDIRNINILNTEGYQVYKRFMIEKDVDPERFFAGVQMLLKYTLGIINDETSKNISYRFGVGINNEYYITPNFNPDMEGYAERVQLAEQQNVVSAANMAFVTNGRGFLKLMYMDDNISRIELSGSFLKILDLDPATTYVFYNETSTPVKLLHTGHDYFILRCNQCKNTLDNLKTESLPQFSNVLAVVPSPGTGYVRYDVPHTGTKIMMHGRTLDNINLVFHDKWGQPLYGMQDFYLEITVDFLKIKDLKPSMNMMELKQL